MFEQTIELTSGALLLSLLISGYLFILKKKLSAKLKNAENEIVRLRSAYQPQPLNAEAFKEKWLNSEKGADLLSQVIVQKDGEIALLHKEISHLKLNDEKLKFSEDSADLLGRMIAQKDADIALLRKEIDNLNQRFNHQAEVNSPLTEEVVQLRDKLRLFETIKANKSNRLKPSSERLQQGKEPDDTQRKTCLKSQIPSAWEVDSQPKTSAPKKPNYNTNIWKEVGGKLILKDTSEETTTRRKKSVRAAQYSPPSGRTLSIDSLVVHSDPTD
ncbi:hypothetical protein [Photobacterium kagoshimensis]|uniref:hypothetical protein n=1 Tax=Photobacterium kagoshimensis TaxID=2910242 RepID=UPI003D0AE7DC